MKLFQGLPGNGGSPNYPPINLLGLQLPQSSLPTPDKDGKVPVPPFSGKLPTKTFFSSSYLYYSPRCNDDEHDRANEDGRGSRGVKTSSTNYNTSQSFGDLKMTIMFLMMMSMCAVNIVNPPGNAGCEPK